ncbi:MAG: HAD-IC family P-type ATPase [Dehalococcoidia bacterium]|nr:HAD-IC family P-type ATPase [Dehalococcoidia bacterium]MDZ4247497.1 HAD-IC family P-type ATPase [Dehalococcoidia bacterium]
MLQTFRWYQMPTDGVLKALDAGEEGLGSAEARNRLAHYGPNELEFKGKSPLIRFLQQFNSPLIYVLLASTLVTAILNMWVDAAVILVVVLANTVIGFIQEGKAEASIEGLKKMMIPECTVLRNNEIKVIPARELVPGDIVILEEGNCVPADLRLLHAWNLAADEAALTGESLPAQKNTQPVPGENIPPGDQKNMVFSGTFITRGTGRGIVVGTGAATEIGKIATLIKESPRNVPAPLIRKLSGFTRVLLIAVTGLAVLNLVLGIALGYDPVYSFLASVSLAVAAIPEGLPAVLTIALAAGAKSMARRNVLIRRLPAVETLGSTTVICSDKTGTLTKNEMTVVKIYCEDREYSVTGAGYYPAGAFTLGGETIEAGGDPVLVELLRAGLLCNNSTLESTADVYKILGDPTEGALKVSAAKAGIADDMTRLDEIPFESELRYMATLHRGTNGNVIYIKGSPEKIIGMCSYQLFNGVTQPLDGKKILSEADEMARQALRVLGLAYKEAPGDKTAISGTDLEEFIFLGFQGMIDPPREEVMEAVYKCKKAGIRVIMATGDHAQTALAIAKQIGIANESIVLTGEDLSAMSEQELFEAVERVSVFARVAPVHKFQIVTQLKKRGHVVAVTGDGVNDAPALKNADLGIAMGIKGTEVSKEASDMVLVDDSFASIVAAVEEGRHVYENIRKVILYTLPTNGGQALLVMGAIILAAFIPLFATRLPLEPVQILWINLYDAVVLALPLLWEPREKGLLDRPPRDPGEPIANTLFFRKVGLVSIIMAVSGFVVFYHFGAPAVSGLQVNNHLLTQAQTAVLVNIMLVHIFYLLTARSLRLSVFRMNPFSNKWVLAGISVTILVQFSLIYLLPEIGFNPLRTAPFPGEWWLYIIIIALPVIFLVELEEVVAARFGKIFKKVKI